MSKKIPIAIEITGYLILSSIVTIAVIMICPPLIQEPRQSVIDRIRQALALNLQLASVPTMVSFYLFQQQKFVPRMIIPVASPLLQTVWLVCALREIFIGVFFFPGLGIAVATILTAYLPIVRKGDFPISTAKLALGVAAELLLPFILMIMELFFR